METFLQDIRYGARALRKAPGFTAAATLTLALGVAANTAVFSVVDAVLVRPLAYPAPDRLVSVTGTYPNGGNAAADADDGGCCVRRRPFVHLIGVGEPVRLSGTRISAELFSVLGIKAARGRTFESGEDTAGRDHVVILSHALWQQRFGSGADIIGRSIELEGAVVR